VGDVQGRERRARPAAVLGQQDGGGPGRGAAVDEGDGRARSSSTSPGTTSTSSASSAYSARHHDGGRSIPKSRSTSSAGVTRRAPSSVSATGR
jgi:hypothetical protein